MKRVIALFFAVALVATALSACGAKAQTPQQLIAGKWNAGSSSGLLDFSAMEFVPDPSNPLKGNVNLSLIAGMNLGTYVITPADKKGDPDHLAITYTLAFISTTSNYTMTVDETTLALTSEKTGVTLTYHRPAASTTANTTA